MPDLSRVCNLHHSSRQRWVLNPPSKARDPTHILVDTNQILNPLSHSGNSLKSTLKLVFFPTVMLLLVIKTRLISILQMSGFLGLHFHMVWQSCSFSAFGCGQGLGCRKQRNLGHKCRQSPERVSAEAPATAESSTCWVPHMLSHLIPPAQLCEEKLLPVLQARRLRTGHQPGSGSGDRNAGRLTPKPMVVPVGRGWSLTVPRGSDDHNCPKSNVSRGEV